MPELPEVETLVCELNGAVKGREIRGVEIRNESILGTPRERMESSIPGKKIIRVGRRGKYIRMDLSEGNTLWIHLGMTGQLILGNLEGPLRPHTHLILSFANSRTGLFYRDARRFGRIALTPCAEQEFPEGVGRLGPEPWDWTEENFAARFKERKARIKNLLLNQGIVAGLGNIYADESLYRAGIHPLRRAHRIPRQRLMRLHQAICEVLEEATQWGGSSIDDYLHLDGKKGRFQEFHHVYGRSGEACQACGTRIRKVKLSGRTSSFCPRCQLY